MRVFALGGAGMIAREAVRDLLTWERITELVLADSNPAAGESVAAWLDDPRVRCQSSDVDDATALVAAMRGYDLVLDGTPISVNSRSIGLIAEAGVSGLNLNGLGTEWDFDGRFRERGLTFIPGFGMTPGVTNLLAMSAAAEMERVDTVRISHGAYRPIAFSRAICETTMVEYDPALPTRTVFEDGEFVQVPPFARPRRVELPAPFGPGEEYIIPHPEGLTLSKSLADKGVRLIEVRGTWPQPNMQLLRALYDWGILSNPRVTVNGAQVGVLDVIAEYLLGSEAGTQTAVYGYALHVEVEGERAGRPVRTTLWTTHPRSDGSVPDWAGLRAYTRSVGIPFAVAARLMLEGKAAPTGVVAPEEACNPTEVFAALARRGIMVHEAEELL